MSVCDSDGNVKGTAFLVGQDVALTCLHVVSAAGKDFGIRAAGSHQIDRVLDVDIDEDLDLALVRVSTYLDRSPVRINPIPPVIGNKIQSRGFPRDHVFSKYPEGFPLDPTEITGDTTLRWRTRLVKLLVLAGAEAEKGMSGAPAVDPATGTVVGVLRFSETGSARALAIRAVDILQRWPKLSQSPGILSYQTLVAAVAESLAATAWQSFAPEKMHCVVVGAEVALKAPADQRLDELFQDVMADARASEVWKSFRLANHDRRLLQNQVPRSISEAYVREQVQIASFNVVDALSNQKSFELAIRMLVEADLALIDVTKFEPAVMLLLGIRAATRRGVTIASVGGGWREGEPLARPFNLSDLSLSSHSPPALSFVGEDPRIDRLSRRIGTGFTQLARHPAYEDLPVYDSLRRLGSAEAASGSIPVDEEVLVLCSYDASYFATWSGLRRELRKALFGQGLRTNVARLQDLPTPQLVSQSLYERIRRCAGCVCDWTLASPSTFFELGVRLTVSPWGAVQVVSRDWLEWLTSEASGIEAPKIQIGQLAELFQPLVYSGGDYGALSKSIADQLIEVRRAPGTTEQPVRQAAAEALRRVQEALPDVFDQLTLEADSLSHPGRIRTNVPQALFYEIREIKEDHERAAIDRRLAAWLFLEHVAKAGELDASNEKHRLWRELGDSVAADLFLSDNPSDLTLASQIAERIT
jgi:hypothetical protein